MADDVDDCTVAVMIRIRVQWTNTGKHWPSLFGELLNALSVMSRINTKLTRLMGKFCYVLTALL